MHLRYHSISETKKCMARDIWERKRTIAQTGGHQRLVEAKAAVV